MKRIKLKDRIGKFPLQQPLTEYPVSVTRISASPDIISRWPHRHNFNMLFWSVSGSGKHSINFRPYEIKQGRVFLTLEGQMHQVQQYPDSGWLVIFDNMLFQSFISHTQLIDQPGIFDHFNMTPYIDLESGMVHTFNYLAGLMEAEISQGGHLQVIRQYLYILLLYCHRHYQLQQQMRMFHPYAETVAKLKFLIGKHFTSQRRTSFYSRELGLSPRKLNEITTATMGKLVWQLIEDRVLAESECLLATTQKLIKEIASELGFIDQSHFAIFFRKHKETNPIAFRKRFSPNSGWVPERTITL